MTAMPFRSRPIDRIVKEFEVIRACEHAAGVVAPFCPVADIEAYVQTCTNADRRERRYDLLINMISAFIAPALMLTINGPGGFIAAALFIGSWAFVGPGQCMTQKAKPHSAAVAHATSKLCQAVNWTPEELAAHGVTIQVISYEKRS